MNWTILTGWVCALAISFAGLYLIAHLALWAFRNAENFVWWIGQ